MHAFACITIKPNGSAAMELADHLTGTVAGVLAVANDHLTFHDRCIIARALHDEPRVEYGDLYHR